MLWLLLCGIFVLAQAVDYTLPGKCPEVHPVENFDSRRFSGVWYNKESYASDGRHIYDCDTLDFDDDNMGFILKDTFVMEESNNKTLKFFVARVDPTLNSENKGHFVFSYENGDTVLQFPFYILAVDYEKYALAYTCKTLHGKTPMHYVFSWTLSRSKEDFTSDTTKAIDSAISKHSDLAAHKPSYVKKDFSAHNCPFVDNSTLTDVEMFINYFW